MSFLFPFISLLLSLSSLLYYYYYYLGGGGKREAWEGRKIIKNASRSLIFFPLFFFPLFFLGHARTLGTRIHGIGGPNFLAVAAAQRACPTNVQVLPVLAASPHPPHPLGSHTLTPSLSTSLTCSCCGGGFK